MLEYAREHGCYWDTQTSAAAVKSGRQELVEWLHHNWCPFVYFETGEAARNGDLDLLAFLPEQCHPRSKQVCSTIADKGDLVLSLPQSHWVRRGF